jgi:hypothetical protein
MLLRFKQEEMDDVKRLRRIPKGGRVSATSESFLRICRQRNAREILKSHVLVEWGVFSGIVER